MVASEQGMRLKRFELPWRLGRWPVRRVLLKQLLFSGLESAALVLLVGVLAGVIIVSQLHLNFGQSGQETILLLAQLCFRELAPLLTALILIARSASAMASELASMQVHGELQSLERMGIPVRNYLVRPRLLAMLCSALVLQVYFLAGAILAGSAMTAGFSWDHELGRLLESVPLSMVLASLGKAAVFGVLIAAVACREGLRPTRSMTDIPRASSRAVIKCLVLLFVADGLLVFLR